MNNWEFRRFHCNTLSHSHKHLCISVAASEVFIIHDILQIHEY